MRTRKEERYKAKEFLSKAEEHLEIARLALAAGKPNSAIGLAVLSAVSAGDAFTVHFLGERSAAESHQESILLFKQVKPADPGVQSAAKQYARILDFKSALSYTPKRYSLEEAKELVRDSERLAAFVGNRLHATD